jgi:DNA mismatch repair protein MutS
MADDITPMMRQYRQIKAKLPPGVILFFRLGDFYEMFFEDAKEAAPILDIALTKRQTAPMCGVPYHSVNGYISKLIKAGRKVAICEQTEDPADARGIVRREVTRIVTPGTVMEDNILESSRHNYLAGVCRNGESFGLAALDLSTGLFWGEETDDADALRDNLKRLAPTECLAPAEQMKDPLLGDALNSLPSSMHVTGCEDWTFEYEAAYDGMVRHFAVKSLEGFGCEGKGAIVRAAGGVLHYVKEELLRQLGHVTSFHVRTSSDFLLLDEATCANLDLAPLRAGSGGQTLLRVLDVTKTAMGARKLREWTLRPLADLKEIGRRHDAVEAFTKDRRLMTDLREELAKVRDMERLLARTVAGTGNARDVAAIGQSLACLPGTRKLVDGSRVPPLQELAAGVTPLPELVGLIGKAITDEPPITIKEGGIFRDGYNAQLDELRHATSEGRAWLAEYQTREQQRTGIKTLKVRHNKVFGYYIEVSKGQSNNVPADYSRKQTLVNAERFITPELKEYENRIFGAAEKAAALEYELFVEIRDAVIRDTRTIQASSEALAQLDALASLAERALAMRYTRPVMTAGDAITIRNGRHPVIEQMPGAERFVPNDTTLDCSVNQLIIITGPNMAGKSTYIRQVALIVIMAQMGSFVPATGAEIGVVDRVFTRVGASDDISRGRSTFMVEMQETANILNNATPRSLIVLDEIGRGTSTFDGISIAWAVAEYLHNNKNVKAKTLFATHYHELTDLALTMQGVKNYNVLVREQGDRVVFLRKIVQGGSDKSYGIQVARLAGMPQEVIDRAREILENLEEGEFGETGQPKLATHGKKDKDNPSQMSLFGERRKG